MFKDINIMKCLEVYLKEKHYSIEVLQMEKIFKYLPKTPVV